MKKVISLSVLFVLTSVISVHAQQKDYKTTLAILLKSAENNFDGIIGEKVDSADGLIVYDSKVKFGIGTENLVIHTDYPDEIVYTLSIKKSESKEFKKQSDHFIKTHFPASKYDVVKEGEKGNAAHTTKVFKKNKEHPLLQTGSDIDKNDYIEYYGVVISGKFAY